MYLLLPVPCGNMHALSLSRRSIAPDSAWQTWCAVHIVRKVGDLLDGELFTIMNVDLVSLPRVGRDKDGL